MFSNLTSSPFNSFGSKLQRFSRASPSGPGLTSSVCHGAPSSWLQLLQSLLSRQRRQSCWKPTSNNNQQSATRVRRVTCAIGRITPGCRVRIVWLKVIRLLVVVGLIRGPEPLQAKPSQVTSVTAAERRFPERALRISIYFVRPHEANEENDGKPNGEDVDGPEPRPLQGGHIEALDETPLQWTYTQRGGI